MKLPQYECKRCGHKWVPRTERKPLRCPNPKCPAPPYWDRERVRGAKAIPVPLNNKLSEKQIRELADKINN